MKITIESTNKIVLLDGVQCRVWQGQSEAGVILHCYIPRIAAAPDQDLEAFARELTETRAPTPDIEGIPLRMIL